jgi:hypothetical protein
MNKANILLKDKLDKSLVENSGNVISKEKTILDKVWVDELSILKNNSYNSVEEAIEAIATLVSLKLCSSKDIDELERMKSIIKLTLSTDPSIIDIIKLELNILK